MKRKTPLKSKSTLKSKTGFKKKSSPNSMIRLAAEGQECQVRLPGICNGNSASTVLAHMNGAGMAQKAPDFQGSHCCDDCHDVIDGRVQSLANKDTLKLFLLEGIMRTQYINYCDGLIKTPGSI
jgi:hypothetical protein